MVLRPMVETLLGPTSKRLMYICVWNIREKKHGETLVCIKNYALTLCTDMYIISFGRKPWLSEEAQLKRCGPGHD
ncbi:hypothetical protein ABH944_004409 [Caballeronia udeis]